MERCQSISLSLSHTHPKNWLQASNVPNLTHFCSPLESICIGVSAHTCSFNCLNVGIFLGAAFEYLKSACVSAKVCVRVNFKT